MKLLPQITPMTPQMHDARVAIPGFKANPYWTPDPKISGHGVFSGLLGTGEEVIIKPHTILSRANNEARRIETISRLGINTPELKGVFEGTRASYLAVLRYPRLQTLGQLDIDVDIADRSLHRTVKPAIDIAVSGLANMHVKDVVHGDFQAKNAAYGPDGEFVAIDLEKAQPNVQGDAGHNGRVNDLYLLGASLLLGNLLGGRKPSYRVGFLGAHVLGAYAEATGKESSFVDYDKVSDALEKVAKTGKKAQMSKL